VQLRTKNKTHYNERGWSPIQTRNLWSVENQDCWIHVIILVFTENVCIWAWHFALLELHFTTFNFILKIVHDFLKNYHFPWLSMITFFPRFSMTMGTLHKEPMMPCSSMFANRFIVHILDPATNTLICYIWLYICSGDTLFILISTSDETFTLKLFRNFCMMISIMLQKNNFVYSLNR